MKRVNLILIISILFTGLVIGQENKEEFKPSGKAFGKVFFNYHYDLSDGAEQKNTFEVQRAYVGYKYKFSKTLSAKITLDGARQIEDNDGTMLSPYTATLKHAQLDWRLVEPVKLSAGLIGLKQFDTQEKFWGHRYLFKSFQDQFKFGSSADLGANAEITVVKPLKVNLFVLNGEGYSKLQDNMGRMKAGTSVLFEPVSGPMKGLILKGYYDIYGGKVQVNDSVIVSDTASIHTVNFFAGYKHEKFRIGAGYNIQKNGDKFNKIAANQDLWGWSVTATYIINKKFEVFGYLMGIQSNTLEGASESWNADKDGNIVLFGVQYSPVKGVKTALNYREFMYEKDDKRERLIYLNFQFAF